MADTFANVNDKTNPAERWFLIVPGPSDLAIIPRAIVCTVAGDITMVDALGTALPATGVAAKLDPYPYRPTKVTAATGTFYGLY